MRAVLSGLAVLVTLAAAPAALAAVAGFETQRRAQYKDADFLAEVLVVRGGSEANAIAITRGAPSENPSSGPPYGFVVRDAAAPLSPGRGCTAVDSHTVECAAAFGPEVHLGAGDDRLTDVGRTVDDLKAWGGAGDDTLIAGPAGRAALHGGAGEDRLVSGMGGSRMFGGSGADRLKGGAGQDEMLGDPRGAPPAADVLDGGAGVDSVSYADRTRPVVVDLKAPGGDGERGEGDAVSDVERVVGGRGPDVLRGDDDANDLEGGDGADRDVIEGRGGDDRLVGGAGADLVRGDRGNDVLYGGAGARLDGGAGDDRISSGLGPGPAARTVCGTGTDVVRDSDPGDIAAPDCESFESAYLELGRPRSRGRGYVIDVLAPGALGTTCTAHVLVVGRDRTLASRVLARPPGRRTRIRVDRPARRPAGVPRATGQRVRVVVTTASCPLPGEKPSLFTGGFAIPLG